MPALVKRSAVEKDLHCERVYASFISDTSDFIYHCENIAKALEIKLPSGCYTNFRDALFHFRRMVNSTEENEIDRQAFAVEEHSNRARTDAVLSILRHCSAFLQILSHPEFGLSGEALGELIRVQNSVNRHDMHLRLSGIMLEHSCSIRPTDEQFEAAVRASLNFVREFVGTEKYHLALSKLNPQNENVC